MELQHINIKIYVEGDLTVDPAAFIDVFHRWVQAELLDELLIDVADYRHVPAGPGVLLIGHEADYSMDHAGDRWGLRYNRKAALDGDNQSRLRQALWSAANACRLLEAEFDDALKFSRQRFDLTINDRALAPNTPETHTACQPILDTFLQAALGHSEYTTQHQPDPRSLYTVAVEIAKPFDLAAILKTLSSNT